jgi:hypothetical protein
LDLLQSLLERVFQETGKYVVAGSDSERLTKLADQGLAIYPAHACTDYF